MHNSYMPIQVTPPHGFVGATFKLLGRSQLLELHTEYPDITIQCLVSLHLYSQYVSEQQFSHAHSFDDDMVPSLEGMQTTKRDQIPILDIKPLYRGEQTTQTHALHPSTMLFSQTPQQTTITPSSPIPTCQNPQPLHHACPSSRFFTHVTTTTQPLGLQNSPCCALGEHVRSVLLHVEHRVFYVVESWMLGMVRDDEYGRVGRCSSCSWVFSCRLGEGVDAGCWYEREGK